MNVLNSKNRSKLAEKSPASLTHSYSQQNNNNPLTTANIGHSFATSYLSSFNLLIQGHAESPHGHQEIAEELRDFANGADFLVDLGSGPCAEPIKEFINFLNADGRQGPNHALLFEPNHTKLLIDNIADTQARGGLQLPVSVFHHDAAQGIQLLNNIARGENGPRILLMICGLDSLVLHRNEMLENIRKSLIEFALNRPNLMIVMHGSSQSLFPLEDAISIIPTCYMTAGGIHREPKSGARREISAIWDPPS